MNSREFDDIKRLNFEDFLWVVNIVLSILNIIGDKCDKNYLKTHDDNWKHNASKIFKITVIVSLFVYLYFFIRNHNDYEKCSENDKNLYLIRLFSSVFFITGTLCLLYFQFNIKSSNKGLDDLGYH